MKDGAISHRARYGKLRAVCLTSGLIARSVTEVPMVGTLTLSHQIARRISVVDGQMERESDSAQLAILQAKRKAYKADFVDAVNDERLAHSRRAGDKFTRVTEDDAEKILHQFQMAGSTR